MCGGPYFREPRPCRALQKCKELDQVLRAVSLQLHLSASDLVYSLAKIVMLASVSGSLVLLTTWGRFALFLFSEKKYSF